MKTSLFLLGAIAGLLFAGCSTVSSRIEEKSSVFVALTPEQQAKVKQGLIEVGYTQDMVYMALGEADEVKSRLSANDNQTTWIYNTYYQRYEGTRFVGYRRVVYFDSRVNAYRVYYEPMRAAIYSDHVEPRTQVIFKDGKVSAIEETQS